MKANNNGTYGRRGRRDVFRRLFFIRITESTGKLKVFCTNTSAKMSRTLIDVITCGV